MSLFLCALGVDWLGIGIRSRGGSGVLCQFALSSTNFLNLLFQAGLSLFEVVVLISEGGGGRNQGGNKFFKLFNLVRKNFNRVEDGIVCCYCCLGVELVL